MAKTKIEWTEETWNPVTGCDPISPGCKNCYAKKIAQRFQASNPKFSNGFEVTCHPSTLSKPEKIRKPQRIFIDSMGDVFHKDVPEDFIQKIFEVMNQTPRHTFQILTKRSERLLSLSPSLNWSPNIWAGVSVESADYLFRIDHLRKCGARTKFVSAEPLLGPLSYLDLTGLDQIIVGGESGPGSRPMHPDWVREIRDKCIQDEVCFFFKQWGGVRKKSTGRILDGRTWDEIPENLTE